VSTKIAVAVTVVLGLLQLLEFYLKIPVLKSMGAETRSWVVIIANFALGLGAANLLFIHGGRALAQRQGWINSAALVVSMVGMVVIGLTWGQSNVVYQFVFKNILEAMASTMYALLAFYIASASYRAFRARNAEAAVLLVSATLVMLGNVPIGEAISKVFPTMGSWLMNVPNNAGQRGILISATVGFVVLSLRVVMGLERGHFRGGAE
jgi:hypothetical protein